MLGSRAMLAVDGAGAAAAAAAEAAAAAVRAGRAGAGLAREAAAELRLHGFIDGGFVMARAACWTLLG